jgi:potassium-dependent mechanosensitive channel
MKKAFSARIDMGERVSYLRHRSGFALLLILTILMAPLLGQNPRTTPSKKSKVVKTAQKPSIPQILILPDGEVIPLSDVVPRAEAAQKQLQQMLTKIRTPEITQAADSLSRVSKRVSESAGEAEKAIKSAASPLQLTEIRIPWVRNRAELESVSGVVARYTKTVEDFSRQSQAERKTWDAIAKAAIAARLPAALVARVTITQTTASQVEAAFLQESNNLIELQVQLSESSKAVDDLIEQLNIAEAAMREQIFVLESPPLWASPIVGDWPKTKQHIADYVSSAINRSKPFIHANRSKLFFYLLFWCAVLMFVVHLGKKDLSGRETGIDSHYFVSLRHPYAITFLLALAWFGLAFTRQPPELARLLRILTAIPVVLIARSLVGRELRPFIVALAVVYGTESMSLALFGGTPLRRVISLLISSVVVAGLAYALRKGKPLRGFVEERLSTPALIWLHFATLLVAISIPTNIIGNISFADVLTFGTITSTYWALLLYVLYSASVTIVAAVTASDLGRKSRAIDLHGEIVNRTAASYLKMICVLAWVVGSLFSFQLYNETIAGVKNLIIRKWQLGAISISLMDVLLFCLVLMASSIIAKFIRFMLNEEILPRASIQPGVAQAGSRLTYSGLLILGMFLAFGAAGLELSKLTLLTGAFGVGLGFGLQNVVSNFVSGIILSLEQPMKIGDYVEVDGRLGEVTAIGFRSSTVRTFEGANVIVPNSDLVTKSFVNWSLTGNIRRTDIQINVAYGTDTIRVSQLLRAILMTHPDVHHRPTPEITLDQFGESALNFTIRFWSKLDDRIRIRSEINTEICEQLTKNGIVIPFPQRDVNLKLEAGIQGDLLPIGAKAKSVSAGAE